ncbi:MAG: response regulator [Candidatus Omnitrophica bacterium]|nr:response regulator [Candidatus Omnitrophota bacterium]
MNQRILAVDDEIHMLTLLERIITEKTPYTVVTLNNPLEVEPLLKKTEFDLLILDFKMPGMDGFDILRMLQKNNRPEEVIMITAFGSVDSAIEAMSLGVFDYITKPFKKELILFAVERVMRWQRMRRRLESASAPLHMTPYAEAERAFKIQYIHYLYEQTNADKDEMQKRSGLSHGDIQDFLQMDP